MVNPTEMVSPIGQELEPIHTAHEEILLPLCLGSIFGERAGKLVAPMPSRRVIDGPFSLTCFLTFFSKALFLE